MVLFVAEFPLRRDRGISDFWVAAHRWLSKSPHYPWGNLPPISIPDSEFTEISDGSYRLSLASAADESRTLVGLRHVYTEASKQEWVTDVVGVEDAGGFWVSIAIACNLLRPGGEPPRPKKPYIIKVLLDNLGGGQDGELEVRDRPRHLAPQDLELAARIINGSCQNTLPIVYVSADFTWHPPVDVEFLAQALSGLAHVVVEPSRPFSVALARQVGSRNPYGGAVGIFWPGGGAPPLRLFLGDYASSFELCAEIEQRVKYGWLFAKSPRGVSWLTVREVVSARRLEQLRRSGSKSLEEFVAAFDEENAALRAQIEELSGKLSHLTRAYDELQHRFASRQATLLAAGSEQEFYPGEALDAVVRTLEEDMAGLSPDSRRRTVIQDILAANSPSSIPQEIEREIRKTLENAQKIGERETTSLEKLGFKISDDGKHYKAVFHDDARYTFTLHKTASDFRSSKNLSAEIVRKLLKR